jgi:hypothetical protein
MTGILCCFPSFFSSSCVLLFRAATENNMARLSAHGVAPLLVLLMSTQLADAQGYNATSAASNATVTSGLTFANPSGYSTQTYNESAATTNLPNNDYSDERLNFLWAQASLTLISPRLAVHSSNASRR